MNLLLIKRILSSRATWGVGLCLGILVALGAHGALKYRAGYRDGVAHESALRDSTERLSQLAADAERAAGEAREAALRAQAREDDRKLAALAVESAVMGDRLQAAQRRYAQVMATAAASGDTVETPRERACTELASACLVARATLATENTQLKASLVRRDSILGAKDSLSRLEPYRTAVAVERALTTQRATFRAPSRTTWAAVGAVVGSLTTWLVSR